MRHASVSRFCLAQSHDNCSNKNKRNKEHVVADKARDAATAHAIILAAIVMQSDGARFEAHKRDVE
jgi:hypothetical protein